MLKRVAGILIAFGPLFIFSRPAFPNVADRLRSYPFDLSPITAGESASLYHSRLYFGKSTYRIGADPREYAYPESYFRRIGSPRVLTLLSAELSFDQPNVARAKAIEMENEVFPPLRKYLGGHGIYLPFRANRSTFLDWDRSHAFWTERIISLSQIDQRRSGRKFAGWFDVKMAQVAYVGIEASSTDGPAMVVVPYDELVFSTPYPGQTPRIRCSRRLKGFLNEKFGHRFGQQGEYRIHLLDSGKRLLLMFLAEPSPLARCSAYLQRR